MGGDSAPPAPDYVGAANAQGQANLQATIASGKINNPNINNPYGTQSVTWGSSAPPPPDSVKTPAQLAAWKANYAYTPTLTQTLAPAQQAIFDQQNAGKLALSKGGAASAQNVQDLLSSKLDFSKLPGSTDKTPGAIRDEAYNAIMGRVNTDIAGQRSAKNSELIAAGIRPGTAAYQNAMMQIDRQANDAQQQAILSAGQEGSRDYQIEQTNRNQAIFELLQQRQVPINEINALLSGSQVTSPFSGGLGYQAGQGVQAAPIAGAIQAQGQAQQNQYNQQQAGYNANIGAGAGLIGSLGSAWLGK